MHKSLLLSLCILMALALRLPALAAPSSTFESCFEQANNLFKQGKFDEAISEYQHSLTFETTYPQVHFNMGMSYMNKQEWDKARTCFDKAIALNQSYTKAYVQAGHALQKKEKPEEAIPYYKKALILEFNNAEVHLNLGRVLAHATQYDDAIYHIKQALKIDPKDTNSLLELGNTYNLCNKTEEALDTYQKLSEIAPNNPAILYNIGYTLKKLGKIDEAIGMYKKVLALSPSHPDAHFGLGLSYMLKGEFDLGWPEYEWRWQRSGYAPRNLKPPLWDGIADLQDKVIFLHAEQGLGDTLEFIRYAKVVKDRGATVVVAVQSALATLMRECPYIDKVITLQDSCPSCDYQVPLMTLPLLLKTTVDTVPTNIPYLYADPELIAYWHEKLSHDKGFKVGICWQGNPNYATHFLRVTVAAKSIPVSMFAPLADVSNISIYSLQRESGTDQLRSLNNKTLDLHTFNDDFDKTHGRFMDTAAVIKNLDLVITVDTSIAHLAGGLGVPTWVFIPEPPDWRWMLNRSDTPWYPNMRLFRQPTPGDWQSVITTITHELCALIEQKQDAQ